jgi:hypothetical protein
MRQAAGTGTMSMGTPNSPNPLIPLCLRNLLSKMPFIRVKTVGSQGLIPRGTFREHFTFHSWQAEMDCQTAFEREADSQTRLAP